MWIRKTTFAYGDDPPEILFSDRIFTDHQLIVRLTVFQDFSRNELGGYLWGETEEDGIGLVKTSRHKIYTGEASAFNINLRLPFSIKFQHSSWLTEFLLEIWEWTPLEFIVSQVVEVRESALIFPERSLRVNWYLENQGDNPILLKWGVGGNEWSLLPGQFFSGEKGRNKDLFAKSLLGSQLNFIENWEE